MKFQKGKQNKTLFLRKDCVYSLLPPGKLQEQTSSHLCSMMSIGQPKWTQRKKILSRENACHQRSCSQAVIGSICSASLCLSTSYTNLSSITKSTHNTNPHHAFSLTQSWAAAQKFSPKHRAIIQRAQSDYENRITPVSRELLCCPCCFQAYWQGPSHQ